MMNCNFATSFFKSSFAPKNKFIPKVTQRNLLTGAQYKESLSKRGPAAIWVNGKRVPTEDLVTHPSVAPSINSVALSFDLAFDEKYKNLAVAYSPLVDDDVNRFTHLFSSTDDLVSKVKFQRLLGKLTGTCFQRCVGMDAINALYISTWEDTYLAKEKGWESNDINSPQFPKHEKFKLWLRDIQLNDHVVCGAMTDPKGDRKKRPMDQRDYYLHVVERRSDGVVLRGAKIHQTGALNSHWILCMPNTNMREGEEDFAISAAVKFDTEGMIYILGRQPSDDRKGTDDAGNKQYGGQEVVVYFDDVFVPYKHVFIDGNLSATTTLLSTFTSYHRASYGGCKPGNLDVLIGASLSLSRHQGTATANHVKDKLVEMAHLTETVHSCGLAASYAGHRHPSGVYQVDHILANVCKQNVTRLPYEVVRLAEDLAGGLVSTLPPLSDLNNPEIAHIMQNVLISKDRGQLLRLIEYMTSGAGSVPLRIECMHGAGSPQAQRMVLEHSIDWNDKVNAANNLAGVKNH